jgi:predicted anti-sigma-YlaC factor YlaD
MKCEEVRELMPELSSGLMGTTPQIAGHLAECGACAGKLEELQQTMALLDEWQAPEPSPYFETRLQARLREEIAKPQAGWLQWFRRPVLAAALTVLLGVGVGLYVTHQRGITTSKEPVAVMEGPGTAVSDLQTLDKNHDMYADFDLLDDLELQQDVVANP